jgi:alkyl sulfatase BDS1-like metallo-beta-lactamase superfamily hydrolase
MSNVSPSRIPKDAEPATRQANEAVRTQLPFEDRRDFEDAARGFIASLPDAVVTGANDRVVWSLADYRFLQSEHAPPTVHPSLWRQARLNLHHGLFQVTPGVYQVRGFDISNMTIVEARTGVIVIDPLISVEVARAGLELYFEHRGRRPVVAVIYTHSHVDHWGGVKGVVGEANVERGAVPVIAPTGFMEYVVSENVIAGNAMSRRAHYQFGRLLPKGERGQVDAGLGKTVSSGRLSLIAPTDVIERPVDTRTVDGVEIVFQLASGAEAPAEFHMFFPAFGTLDMAENVMHTFHNLLPFRGAEVRDANAWAKYINEALRLFGDRAEILIIQHQWPTWGNERIRSLLGKQRDLYKYVHDQTVRLMNHGLTPTEIAETLELPQSLAREWHTRGYYGTVSHNAKAIYQKYLGWYDGNPVNLNPLPPVDAGRKYVEYMGGAEALIARARKDFETGNYRWVAQVMNHVVFADPGNEEARRLGADALEQLGYMAESATWRNAYLFGALELRQGAPRMTGGSALTQEVLKALTIEMLFDYFAVRLNGPKADGKRIVVNWTFTDLDQRYVLNLENAALTALANTHAERADATLSLTRRALDAVLLRQTTFPEAVQSGQITVDGDAAKLVELVSLLDDFTVMFEIVEPKKRGS